MARTTATGTDTKRPSVVAVTRIPPLAGSADGFAHRHLRFLRALARDADVRVAVVASPHVRTQLESNGGALQLDPAVSVVDVPSNPLHAPSVRGRGRRLRHLLFDRLPQGSYPHSLDPDGAGAGAPRADLVVLFLPQLAHLSLALPPDLPRIYVLEERFDRSLEWPVARLPLHHRLAARAERGKWRRLYRTIGSGPGRFAVISEEERHEFADVLPADRVEVLPHAVDTVFFAPSHGEVDRDIDVLFVGELSLPWRAEPVVDLVRAMRSLCRGSQRRVRWSIVGDAPVDEVRDLSGPDVEVTGYVDDVRPFYARSRVVVVPSRLRTGVKTTLLQAWAMGCATAATPASLAGLPARRGDNVVVAESTSELARAALDLLDDPPARARLGRCGRLTVEEERSLAAISDRFAALCLSEIAGRSIRDPEPVIGTRPRHRLRRLLR